MNFLFWLRLNVTETVLKGAELDLTMWESATRKAFQLPVCKAGVITAAVSCDCAAGLCDWPHQGIVTI